MKSSICIFLIVTALPVWASAGLSRAAGNPPSTLDQTLNVTPFTRAAWLDVNRLKICLTNRGKLDFTASPGVGGAYWPDTNDPYESVVVFDFGPWVLGKVGGVPMMGISEWGSTYSPGPIIAGQPALRANPADSLRYRPYKISQGDSPSSNPDYRDWPVNLGAPVNSQGEPRLFGDQTVWTVFNNLDTTAATGYWIPAPGQRLPIVIQQTAYAHKPGQADSSALLSNVIFIEWTIINTGPVPIESTYVSLWTDIDFNFVGDNLPAVDTAAQLGYCWQGRSSSSSPRLPRAVGFLWLYGPSVPNPGSQAIFRGATRANFRNLPLSSFWGIQTDLPAQDSSFFTAAYSMGTAWNIARGFDKVGGAIVDSVTHQVTKFPYGGDPVGGNGWLCSGVVGGGAGFNLFSGPFTLAPLDTQWVMAALIPASSPDNLECVTLLREAAASLRAMPYSSLVLTNVAEKNPEIPMNVLLGQNYPNPFNPATKIHYALPKRSPVSLIVYNLLGQQVATLVNGEIDAGSHAVQFNGAGLPSGIYFYRLRTGSFVESRKMVLLK